MKRLMLIALTTLQFCTMLPTLAQDTKTYPNQRAQWTEAEGEAWQRKYGPIIGVNCPYPPCDAVSQEAAIALAAKLGYNSVRWWPGGGTNTEAYIKSVEQWAAWAQKYGMTVSPVFPFPQAYFGRADKEQALKDMEAQVRKVIQHFRGDERIILWDVWNEPAMGDSLRVEQEMEWIEHIIKWCYQEGSTQPVTASIIWDAGVPCNTTTNPLRTRREKTEAMMDLHNYHSYSAQDGFNQDTPTMVARIRKMDNRPIVCTECMTRTNGSTFARTLYDFQKYHINFYSWGLYACDPNWEVRWERSTFYNWEPMFHNLLYADGEPIDEQDLPRIKNFRFTETNEDPGAEWTERWTLRRSWRWMNRLAAKGISCKDIPSALSTINELKKQVGHNTLSVHIPYSEYASNPTTLYASFEELLAQAEKAGCTIIPILLTDQQIGIAADALGMYAYTFIDKYHADRRIQAWCLLEQTNRDNEAAIQQLLTKLFYRARYAFPNQPMFAAPMADNKTTPDTLGNDLCNLAWRLSDVCAFSNSKVSKKWLMNLKEAYHRPIYSMSETTIASYPSQPTEKHEGARWPAWKAWQWLSGTETCGQAYSSITEACEALLTLKGKGGSPYNSLCVPFDYQAWNNDKKAFYKQTDKLLNTAASLGMSVLPQLLNDACINIPTEQLKAYVKDIVSRYAIDKRIIAWDLYHKVCSTTGNSAQATRILDAVFQSAWEAQSSQPVYATPTVMTQKFPEGFKPVEALIHGRYNGGWARFEYGSADIALCYKIWCLSDVIAYASNQPSLQLGWLNSTANKFGRPLFCAEWEPVSNEEAEKTMRIFQDMHINWYASGSVDEDLIRNFHYIPVSTGH